MSILISECQFCTNIFRLQILLAIFTCCLGRVNNMFKMFLLKIYWRILHSFHSYFFTIFTNLWIKKFNQRYQFSSYEHEINDHEHELNDHIAANHGGILGMLTLSSGKAIQVSQFQNLNANFAQIFFRVYHNHRYKS